MANRDNPDLMPSFYPVEGTEVTAQKPKSYLIKGAYPIKGIEVTAENPKGSFGQRLGVSVLGNLVGRHDGPLGLAAQFAFANNTTDQAMQRVMPPAAYMYFRHLYGTGAPLTQLHPSVMASVRQDIQHARRNPKFEYTFGAGLPGNEPSYPPGTAPYEKGQNAYVTSQVAQMNKAWPTAYTLGTYTVKVPPNSPMGTLNVHDYYNYQTGNGTGEPTMTVPKFYEIVRENRNPLRWLSAWGKLQEASGHARPYVVDVDIHDDALAAAYNRVMAGRQPKADNYAANESELYKKMFQDLVNSWSHPNK
jgi:hypothetical protein